LVEALNKDKKPDIKKLTKMLSDAKDMQTRNKQIIKAYKQGYSQHMIAKVLELNQATVQRIIKRTKA
jgi:DNA-binding NarL/FixJ family response regulator